MARHQANLSARTSDWNLEKIVPESVVKSRCNERQEIDKDSENFQNLKESIDRHGIRNEPHVREEIQDGKQKTAVVDGWRRIQVACELNLDTVTVKKHLDMDDAEARLLSTTNNMEDAKKDVGLHVRAVQMNKLWEDMGGEGAPSPTRLAEVVGVTKSTINKWTEPLKEEWADSCFDPTSENSFRGETLHKIGITKFRTIGSVTGGGEDGEWLATKTAELDLSRTDLSRIGSLVDEDVGVEKATETIHDVSYQDAPEVIEYVEQGASVDNAVSVVEGDSQYEDLAFVSDDSGSTWKDVDDSTGTVTDDETDDEGDTQAVKKPSQDDTDEDESPWSEKQRQNTTDDNLIDDPKLRTYLHFSGDFGVVTGGHIDDWTVTDDGLSVDLQLEGDISEIEDGRIELAVVDEEKTEASDEDENIAVMESDIRLEGEMAQVTQEVMDELDYNNVEDFFKQSVLRKYLDETGHL